jgi:hypothetical protein
MAMNENGDLAENGPSSDSHAVALVSLEQRVHRLEDAVALLQDTHQLEERVLERIARGRIQAAVPDSAGMILDAGRRLLPAAVEVIHAQANVADAQVHAAAQAHADAAPRPEAPPRPAARPATGLRRPWFLVDLYAELRAMLHMYVDPRYRMTWQGRVVPLALAAAIATSWLWVPGVGLLNKVSVDVVGTLLIKIVDLVLAYFLIKFLSREATRYRETAPDLPPHLRS